jgi:hypothetical protein
MSCINVQARGHSRAPLEPFAGDQGGGQDRQEEGCEVGDVSRGQSEPKVASIIWVIAIRHSRVTDTGCAIEGCVCGPTRAPPTQPSHANQQLREPSHQSDACRGALQTATGMPP